MRVVDADEHGDSALDLDAQSAQLLDLVGVVGHQPDRLDAELGEHRRGHVVAARVVGKPEDAVGVHGVGPLGLESVSADLVGEPDAPPLLAQVEDRALAAPGDFGLGSLELLLAVALHRAEHLARQAFAVDSNRDRPLSADRAGDDRDRLLG